MDAHYACMRPPGVRAVPIQSEDGFRFLFILLIAYYFISRFGSAKVDRMQAPFLARNSCNSLREGGVQCNAQLRGE